MFFQSIYQMITAGTDLNINIRKVDNSLSVAVMPRRNSLKEPRRSHKGQQRAALSCRSLHQHQDNRTAVKDCQTTRSL